jgi:hypothetical protein
MVLIPKSNELCDERAESVNAGFESQDALTVGNILASFQALKLALLTANGVVQLGE